MNRFLFFNLDLTLTRMEKDFDQVLVDTLEEIGVEVEDVSRYSEIFFSYFEKLEEYPREKAFRDYFEEKGIDVDAEEAARIYVEKELEEVRPVEDLKQKLEKLSSEFRLGVITAGTEELQRRKIQKLGIDGLLDESYITYAEGKTKEDILEDLRNRFPDSELIYFSHSDSDIEMAENSGWKTVQTQFNELGENPVKNVRTEIG